MYRVIFMLAGAAVVGLGLVLFQFNDHLVTVVLPILEVHAPLNLALALCFVAGAVVGFALVGRLLLSCRRRVKALKGQAAIAQQEIVHLRRNVIRD